MDVDAHIFFANQIPAFGLTREASVGMTPASCQFLDPRARVLRQSLRHGKVARSVYLRSPDESPRCSWVDSVLLC